MQVYYDSTNYSSRAQLPTTVTVIPEFAASNAALMAFVVIALSLTLLKRESKVQHVRFRGHENSARNDGILYAKDIK